jgi:hypothetical protein
MSSSRVCELLARRGVVRFAPRGAGSHLLPPLRRLSAYAGIAHRGPATLAMPMLPPRLRVTVAAAPAHSGGQDGGAFSVAVREQSYRLKWRRERTFQQFEQLQHILAGAADVHCVFPRRPGWLERAEQAAQQTVQLGEWLQKVVSVVALGRGGGSPGRQERAAQKAVLTWLGADERLREAESARQEAQNAARVNARWEGVCVECVPAAAATAETAAAAAAIFGQEEKITPRLHMLVWEAKAWPRMPANVC